MRIGYISAALASSVSWWSSCGKEWTERYRFDASCATLLFSRTTEKFESKRFCSAKQSYGDVPRYIFGVVFPGDHHDVDPQTPLFRSGAPHLGNLPQADQGGPCLPPCPSGARSRRRAPPPNRVRLATLYLFRAAQMGPSLRQPGRPRLGGSPPPRSPSQSDLWPGARPRSARRPRPAPARLQPFPVELSGTRHAACASDWRATQP